MGWDRLYTQCEKVFLHVAAWGRSVFSLCKFLLRNLITKRAKLVMSLFGVLAVLYGFSFQKKMRIVMCVIVNIMASAAVLLCLCFDVAGP